MVYRRQSINFWNPWLNIKWLKICHHFQVFYRQEGHSNSQVIETQKPQAVVPLPDAGVYIIEVRAYGEGGDGTASSQIRVPSYSGKFWHSRLNLITTNINMMQTSSKLTWWVAWVRDFAGSLILWLLYGSLLPCSFVSKSLSPMDCSLPGSSVHGIFQARIADLVALSFSKGSSQSRDQIQISCICCNGKKILYHWATWEARLLYDPLINTNNDSPPTTVKFPHILEGVNIIKIPLFVKFSSLPWPQEVPYWPYGLCNTAFKPVLLLFSCKVMSNSAISCTVVCQASLSISLSLLKLMSIESVGPANHHIHCHPFLLLPSTFPSIRGFSNERALCIR